VSVPLPLLDVGGTSLLAFIAALRLTTSACTGHANETAVAQHKPKNADRRPIECIVFPPTDSTLQTPQSRVYSHGPATP
jgi:hypothetical protein